MLRSRDALHVITCMQRTGLFRNRLVASGSCCSTSDILSSCVLSLKLRFRFAVVFTLLHSFIGYYHVFQLYVDTTRQYAFHCCSSPRTQAPFRLYWKYASRSPTEHAEVAVPSLQLIYSGSLVQTHATRFLALVLRTIDMQTANRSSLASFRCFAVPKNEYLRRDAHKILSGAAAMIVAGAWHTSALGALGQLVHSLFLCMIARQEASAQQTPC